MAYLDLRVVVVVAVSVVGCVESKTGDAETGATDDLEDVIAQCAAAQTEEACKAAKTPNTAAGEGCRWGEIRRAKVEGDACTLEVVGGECILATFNEGGPGCSGFFREGADQTIDLVVLECGDPADDSWELCFGAEATSPGFVPCQCLWPDEARDAN